MKKLTYKSAGVDVRLGDQVSKKAVSIARSTYRNDTVNFGNFVGVDARFKKYRQPVLLGATDGVGTKLKLAFLLNKHDTVGVDLVAMCVNDLIRRSAEPLMFMPYIATGKIRPKVIRQIMAGVAAGCTQANCTIVGGETAEMPDFYGGGEYDISGCAIGVVDHNKVITGEKIRPGDMIIGLASSGVHSNGFSLIRKIFSSKRKLGQRIAELGKSLGEELLTPARIYVKDILALLIAKITIHGIVHITGGGIPGKLGGIILPGLIAIIDTNSWRQQPIFALIQKEGNIERNEMYRTFNMGTGMILIVPQKSLTKLHRLIPEAVVIGRIESGKERVKLIH